MKPLLLKSSAQVFNTLLIKTATCAITWYPDPSARHTHDDDRTYIAHIHDDLHYRITFGDYQRVTDDDGNTFTDRFISMVEESHNVVSIAVYTCRELLALADAVEAQDAANRLAAFELNVS